MEASAPASRRTSQWGEWACILRLGRMHGLSREGKGASFLVRQPTLCSHFDSPPRRYIEKGLDKAGTEVKLQVRGKVNDAVVTKMPFVPTTYYKG